MPDPANSQLTELREVEARVAARSARIDQLQAALASSRSRGRRFLRTLVLVGYISMFLATVLRLEMPRQQILDLVLVGTAVGLACFVTFSTVAIDRLARGRNFLGPLATSAMARWIARSPMWELPIAPTPFFMLRKTRHAGAWIVLSVLVLICAAWELGNVVLAGFAGVLSVGLLRLIWSRRVSAPVGVEHAASLVALVAVVSAGFWLGGVASAIFRPDLSYMSGPGTARGLPALAIDGRGVPTYTSTCGGQTPWLRSKAPPVLRMREAWLATGTTTAGCPGPARAVQGTGILVSKGIVDGEMRSIAVADNKRAALLVGQPAQFTAGLLTGLRGLVGVPSHLVVGQGDLYLVDTREGTYVLIRRSKAGPAHEGYITIPPTVAGLWIEAMSMSREWLWPIRSHDAYIFASSNSGVVARAACDGASGSCTISLAHGGLMAESGPFWVLPKVLLLYARTSE